VALLVAVPVLVFVLPALFGHPAIAGDNGIQNFPLRVLSGNLLRQGHLPLWNPLIWSGSPLLGGLNAGALYPTTLAFVVLPPVAAWVLNLLVAYWAAGLGMYALLRQYRLAPMASLLGGATYAYTGAMVGQLVHLPIVQGQAWLPLLVLAQLRLAWAVMGTGPARGGAGNSAADAAVDDDAGPRVAAKRQSPWPWVVLLAVIGGLVLLTGEPRGMADTEIVALIVFGWLVLRPYGGTVRLSKRLRYLALTAVAGLWGAALGAVQLLPGQHFISASQRANETFAFFGAGSLRPSWSILELVPDLFGGDGLLHQPTFFNSYNLPEVTGYVGLLPLVAAFGLLTVSLGRRRARSSSDWGLWLLLLVLGALLAWGEFTPLGGLFGHIPFFDRLRLQSRNLAIADLGLAGLLAFWIDRLFSEREQPEMNGWRRWVSLLPALAALFACLTMLIAPYRFEIAMGMSTSGAALGTLLRPWMVAQLVVAVAVCLVVLFWRRLPCPLRGRLLWVVLVGDVLLFTISSSTGLSAGNVVVQPGPQPGATVLGTTGRFAIYDTTALNLDDLSVIGQPDLNVFTKLQSVQGYGSILDNSYGTATGSHTLDNLSACALATGQFAQLRLATVLTLPKYLAPMVTPGSQPRIGSADSSTGPGTDCPAAPAPGTATERSFYFGTLITVGTASLVKSAGGPATATTQLRVGLRGADGAVTWPRETVEPTATGWSVTFADPAAAVGLVVRGPAQSVSDQSTITSPAGPTYRLDGILQDALGQTSWRFRVLWRQYASFSHPAYPAAMWLARPAPGAQVAMVRTTDWGTDVASVRAPHGATVVRSVTFQMGWHVQARAADGSVRSLPVLRYGLVQSVVVPAGTWQLTFLYRPQGLDAGLAATGAGIVLLLVAAAWAMANRRRDRPRVTRQGR
jgi:hypothetical protein